MSAPVCTAPADQLLTDLHVDGGDGSTVCGLELRPEQVWLPVDRRDGDRVCPACRGVREPEMEEAVLW